MGIDLRLAHSWFVSVEAQHECTSVEPEAGSLQALAGARVAGVQDRHVVFLGQCVDRGEQAREIGLGVDVLLAVGGQQHVALGLQAELREDIGRLDLVQVVARRTSAMDDPVTYVRSGSQPVSLR